MKILALIFLFGFAAAISHKDLERARDEVLLAFMEGMETAPSLREAVSLPYAELDEIENDIKTGLVKSLRDALNTLLKGIKDAIDHGKTVKEDMKEHVQKIKEHLKKLHEDIGNKAREMLERIKDKVKGKFREWLEKLGLREREERALAQSTLRDFLTTLREKLNEKGADAKKILEEMAEKFKEHGTLIKIFLRELKDGTVEKIKSFIDKLLGKKESRAAKDVYEKIKEYIKEIRDGFEHHFSSFLDWLEKVYKSGADAAKGRIENVKKVALKFLDHVKEVGKKTAHEALEFFRPYKKDLGTLWDELEKRVKEAYGKH